MDDLFYRVGSKKIPLRVSKILRAAQFQTGNLPDSVDRVTESKLRSGFSKAGWIDMPGNKSMIVSEDWSALELELSLAGYADRFFDIPVFEADREAVLVAGGEILIKLRTQVDPGFLEELREEYGFIQCDANPYTDRLYKAILPSPGNTIKIANAIADFTGEVDYAEPNFINLSRRFLASLHGDPLWQLQWALKNDGQFGGQAGADINIAEAWSITRGSPGIIVGVVDEGVDYSHPDLDTILSEGDRKLVPGFDSWGLGAGHAANPLPKGYHGTACAGIIGAAGDNGIGISGIAPECRIMSLKIAQRMEQQIWGTRFLDTHDSMMYACREGVQIFNNSWANMAESNVFNEAIETVTTKGRGGLGCIVVFAAGNAGRRVSYPANKPQVISVTASNRWDQIKSAKSDDKEEGWDNNYGPEIWVCAPGVEIATTSNSHLLEGDTSDDYRSSFSGTSAAAPHVSGVIALMLSVNPYLSLDDVRSILKDTSKQIVGTQGTHSKVSGWGRIDAGRAVASAVARRQMPQSPGQVG